MARPKKQKELKRNHHIMLRLNDTEYDIVTENAQTANLPVAEYARKQVMNQRITTVSYTHLTLPTTERV